MKIQVICEKCGKVVELMPVTVGHHAYVNRELLDCDFYISDVVVECSSSDDLEEITDFDDLSIDKELKELRIDCRDCGEWIILTDFGQ